MKLHPDQPGAYLSSDRPRVRFAALRAPLTGSASAAPIDFDRWARLDSLIEFQQRYRELPRVHPGDCKSISG